MKFVHPEYDLSLELQENKVNVVVVENQKIFTEMIQELYRQCSGGEGAFVLSDKDKILSFHKTAELITDVFSLDCNEKRIIAKLYQEIEELAMENLVAESMELNSQIACYLEKMCDLVPYYLAYQTEFLPSKIMKMVDLRFETTAVTLLEHIVEYLGITSKLHKSMVNIFVNLKSFLTMEELHELYEYTFYNKIPLILLEGFAGSQAPEEQWTIIDIDKCTIKL